VELSRQDEHWDFIYGFTDCGRALQSGLNTAQYEDFVSAHVDLDPNSVPKLINLAPRRVRALKQLSGGEVWTEKHGFNDGDLWGDSAVEGRVWVEGYLACKGQRIDVRTADRYVQLMLRHYSNPKRHLDKLADVLEPLLKKSSPGTQP